MKLNIKKKILLNLLYLFIFYFANKFSQTYFLIFDGNIGTNLMQAMNLVFKVIEIYPLPSLLSKNLLIGIMSAGIFRLILYIKSRNPKKYRKGIEYGSARWGTPKDIEPFIEKKFENNIILTQTEKLMINDKPKNPIYARNKNVLVIGGSGSGKTRFFVKPNLMQMHSSYVVTDPKGLVFRGQRNPHKTKENLRVCRR